MTVYSTVDEVTKQVILNLYHPRAAITVVNSQKQEGASECGLFALANATAIAFGLDSSNINFNQAAMRAHLVQCFKEGKMALFPTIS